ncbi:unnamed protein product, partial [Prorocentrum cordatum]
MLVPNRPWRSREPGWPTASSRGSCRGARMPMDGFRRRGVGDTVNEPSCSSSAPWRQTAASTAAAQLPAPLAAAPWRKVDVHVAAAALPAPASASSSPCRAAVAEIPTATALAEEIEDAATTALARFLSACEPPAHLEERSPGQSIAEDVPQPPPPPFSSDEGTVQATEPPPPPDDELLPKLPVPPLPVSPAGCAAE